MKGRGDGKQAVEEGLQYAHGTMHTAKNHQAKIRSLGNIDQRASP